MVVWFEGTNEIECDIDQIKQDFRDHGSHYEGVIGLMPGLANVDLVEQGDDFVIIRTNEGLMKRTNISKLIESESIVIEFDEEYQAWKMVTVKAHYLDEFTKSQEGVKHRIVISNLETTGLMGFLYKTFGKSNMGNAFLASYKTYFEQR